MRGEDGSRPFVCRSRAIIANMELTDQASEFGSLPIAPKPLLEGPMAALLEWQAVAEGSAPRSRKDPSFVVRSERGVDWRALKSGALRQSSVAWRSGLGSQSGLLIG